MTDATLSRQIPTLTEIEAELLRRDFRRFIHEAWPLVEPKPFVSSWHIDAIAEHLLWVTIGEISQLSIGVPPRMSKSMTVSTLWQPWVWTDPARAGMQWLCGSYAEELSVRDAVKSRRLIQSNWYQERWGGVFYLSSDENLKSYFSNNRGGYRIATSVGGTGTGHGGDILLLDDPHNLKEIYSDTKRGGVIEWYKNVFRNRVNDPNNPRRVLIMQRGHDVDLAGWLYENEGDEWTQLVLPNEFDPSRRSVTVIKGEKRFEDPRTKKDELLCPARMDEKATKAQKRVMTKRDYQAQYNQDPAAGGGIILLRDHWRCWPHKSPPPVVELFSCYDTAFEKDEEADYSARTTWGVFMHSETGDDADLEAHIILLGSWYDRCTYPELKKEIQKIHARFEEDYIVIEKKASGHSLLQDLKADAKKYPVLGFKPKADKIARAHMAAFPLEQGKVWFLNRDWADEAITIASKFPATDKKDLVDTITMALIRFRKRFMMDLDEPDEDRDELTDVSTRRKRFYG